MTAPVIDLIDNNNFQYRPTYNSNILYMGIFEWGFRYKEMQVPQRLLVKRLHRSEPYWWEIQRNSPSHISPLALAIPSFAVVLGDSDFA